MFVMSLPGLLSPGALPFLGYTNLALVVANVICLSIIAWAQFRRKVKYYDRAIRILEDEQGEWYVNFVIERELAKLFKHYTRAGADAEEVDGDEDDNGRDDRDGDSEEDKAVGDEDDGETEEDNDSDGDSDGDDDDSDGDDDSDDGDDDGDEDYKPPGSKNTKGRALAGPRARARRPRTKRRPTLGEAAIAAASGSKDSGFFVPVPPSPSFYMTAPPASPGDPVIPAREEEAGARAEETT